MSRDFEFKQLLRAYRSGVISQATFESEMAGLEAGTPTTNGNGNGSGGFKAFGRTYKSERAAVVSFLDKVRAGEANGGEAFAAWAEVCKTDCIRTGIRIVAEREAYHSRVFAQRLAELGGPPDAGTPQCGSCTDCANQACVNGTCGSCTSSAQCCPPLLCLGGSCGLPGT